MGLSCKVSGHGRWYVGAPGGDRGYRTDRCPRSWAGEPFAVEVATAHWWKTEGGGFSVYVPRPPALLIDAITFFAAALSEMYADEFREKPHADRGRDPGSL